MKRTIKVFLGGVNPALIGMIYYYQQGSRESEDRFSIDPTLPLVTGTQFHKKTKDGSPFYAVITDTEPDGWAKRVILRDHAKRRQSQRRSENEPRLSPLNNLDFLLAVDDESRMGALRFQDEDAVFQRAPAENGQSTTPPLIELGRLLSSSRAIETNTETAKDLDYLRGKGTSLGGLQGQWRLSPAFDLNPFPERIKELKTWISEDTGPECSIDALMSVLSYFRIKPKRGKEILGEVKTAVSGWKRSAKKVGMTDVEIGQFSDAFVE